MKKQQKQEETKPAIRPISEMSPRALLAERLRKMGYDCSVSAGVLVFYVGLERTEEVRQLLKKNDYDESWGIYPLRND